MLADACLRYGEEDHDDLFCAVGLALLLEQIDEPTANFLIDWESDAELEEALDHPDGMPSREEVERIFGDRESVPPDMPSRSGDWLFRLTHFGQMKLIWRKRLLAMKGDGAAMLRPLVEQSAWSRESD